MTITATEFYNYVQCPAKVYLNKYGDEGKKLPLSEFMQKKMQDGIQHEKEVISDMDFIEVEPTSDQQAFMKTLQLMRLGVNRIYQGVLMHNKLYNDLLKKKKFRNNNLLTNS